MPDREPDAGADGAHERDLETERSSERRVTRPFAMPTASRARSVQARLTASATLREKKKYGQSGMTAAAR